MAGGHKHKWTKLLKTGYFGKKGFTPVRRTEKRTINLMQVSALAMSETINLASLGYQKLLGCGKLFKPLTIVVEEWSRKAAEKVEKAGGRLVKPEAMSQP